MTVEARVHLSGRKRVPSLVVYLRSDAGQRTQLASLADVGRSDVGSEIRAFRFAVPVALPAGCEIELVAEDMRAEPFVQRFRAPIQREPK